MLLLAAEMAQCMLPSPGFCGTPPVTRSHPRSLRVPLVLHMPGAGGRDEFDSTASQITTAPSAQHAASMPRSPWRICLTPSTRRDWPSLQPLSTPGLRGWFFFQNGLYLHSTSNLLTQRDSRDIKLTENDISAKNQTRLSEIQVFIVRTQTTSSLPPHASILSSVFH